jgi:zinc protease
MNLRQEKGYSYGYTSSIDWLHGPSALLAGGGVQTAVTKEAVAETLKEFTDIRGERPVTEEEFTAARTSTLRGLPSQFETVGQTLRQLIRLAVFDLPADYFATLPSAIEAVTLDDVRRVAEKRLDGSHLAILVVGDAEVVEPGLAELGIPIVRVDYEGRKAPPS